MTGSKQTSSKQALTIVLWVYLVACVLALLLLPPMHHSWFGIERRPLGGFASIVLALPWSLAMRFLHYHGTAYSTVLITFAMACNLFLLLSLRRRLE